MLVLLLGFNIAKAQKPDLNSIKNQANAAFEAGEFETTISLVNQMQSLFKQIPPSYQSLRIKALSIIVARNTLPDFQRIVTTRKFIDAYLNNPSSKNDPSFNAVDAINDVFNLYPKDERAFLALIEAKKNEQKLEDERKAREAEKARFLKIEADSIAALNALEAARIAEIQRLQRIKSDSIARFYALDNERLNQIELERIRAQASIDAKKAEKNNNFKTRPFSNFGFQSGEIAKYGLLYEYGGGKKFLGFHITARTSLPAEQDVLSGKIVENRNELDLGPSFKLSDWLFLNLGGGYGFYNYVFRNDFAGETARVEMEPYLVTSGGLMIRLGRLINLSGGVSFMDIDKGLYKPEITGGLSFNFKSNK